MWLQMRGIYTTNCNHTWIRATSGRFGMEARLSRTSRGATPIEPF
jgi:hypothetical protein